MHRMPYIFFHNIVAVYQQNKLPIHAVPQLWRTNHLWDLQKVEFVLLIPQSGCKTQFLLHQIMCNRPHTVKLHDCYYIKMPSTIKEKWFDWLFWIWEFRKVRNQVEWGSDFWILRSHSSLHEYNLFALVFALSKEFFFQIDRFFRTKSHKSLVKLPHHDWLSNKHIKYNVT